MPPKSKQKGVRLPLPPSIAAAELPYRLSSNAAASPYEPPPSTSHSTVTGLNNAPYAPYSQRIRSLNADLTARPRPSSEDPKSSNESSSEPSSKATSRSQTGSTSTGYTSPGLTETWKHVGLPPDSTLFEMLMARYEDDMPPPGPSYFERRRALWYTPPVRPPSPPSPSPSRVKLEALLGQPGAVESDEVWKAGLKNVWKGLVGGNMLRKRLPLDIVLKILQAGWLRDGTWPEGAVPPAWDDPVPNPPPPFPEPPSGSFNDLSLTELGDRYKQDLIRHAREQEAYDAAVAARQHAEQYAHAMGFGTGMGIPPGYSPSSGDLDQQGRYGQPYQYAEATPPPEDACSPAAGAGPSLSEIGDEADELDDPNGRNARADDGRHEGG